MNHRFLITISITKSARLARRLLLAWLLLPFALSAPAADTQTSQRASSRLSYSDFGIISDRNIFNPSRYPRNSSAPRVRVDTSRGVRADYFALLGVMSYEKGPFAFFDGSSSRFRTNAQVNDVISGFKITAIHPNSVRLESGTNHFDLPLGKQLRRPEGGEWQVADRVEVYYAGNDRRSDDRSSYGNRDRDRRGNYSSDQGRGNDNGSFEGSSVMIMQPGGEGSTVIALPNGDLPQPEAGSVAVPAPPTPASDGAENDVLRRLMQRREQELNR